MSILPENVGKAWDERKGPAILTTVDKNAVPNTIYVTCVSTFGEDAIVIADNYFDKTRNNILAGSKGSILFITSEGKAFQFKGVVEYHQEGEIFDDMKKWNPEKHPGHAAAVLRIEEVYSGAEKLM
ncbi:pyridoxamine 5'-phosphate oxidase family protein [Desulfogranum mediterraneum]|uniref:pyridoxamine 5'-phosphate oxidase family protein n=1 Tax=Desulfogranum mediterraneum TaxID=160661 RepID=UPI00048C7C9E|nr:pyridoxamine 5'-phosphate oxidase family protein [Desulfogranum mediterraneum]